MGRGSAHLALLIGALVLGGVSLASCVPAYRPPTEPGTHADLRAEHPEDPKQPPETAPLSVILETGARLGPIESVQRARHVACVTERDGGTYCWGDNRAGEIPILRWGPHRTPTRLPLPEGSRASIENRLCLLHRVGALDCWSEGRFHRLPGHRVREFSVYNGHGCFIDLGGELYCDPTYFFRPDTWAPLPLEHAPFLHFRLPANATEIIDSGMTRCVLDEDGAVRCWGRGRFRHHGLRDDVDRATPIRVPRLPFIRQAAGSSDHTCALDRSGLVWCWGANRHAESSWPRSENLEGPTIYRELSPADLVLASYGCTCTASRDGVRCSSRCSNPDGAYGRASAPSRLRGRAGSAPIVDGFVSSELGCIVDADGGLWCWRFPQDKGREGRLVPVNTVARGELIERIDRSIRNFSLD